MIERLDTVYRYAADGTGSKEITGVIRVQSDAAARQYGVLNIPFAASTEHVEIEYVRARKPDNTIVDTPHSRSAGDAQEVTREAPFYSDLKEKQIPVRNLRTGDRLEYKAKVIRTKAETPGDFWGQEGFGSGVVILNETVELHIPEDQVRESMESRAPARDLRSSRRKDLSLDRLAAQTHHSLHRGKEKGRRRRCEEGS